MLRQYQYLGQWGNYDNLVMNGVTCWQEYLDGWSVRQPQTTLILMTIVPCDNQMMSHLSMNIQTGCFVCLFVVLHSSNIYGHTGWVTTCDSSAHGDFIMLPH